MLKPRIIENTSWKVPEGQSMILTDDNMGRTVYLHENGWVNLKPPTNLRRQYKRKAQQDLDQLGELEQRDLERTTNVSRVLDSSGVARTATTLVSPTCVLSNFPIRGKVWNFTHICCNHNNGNIAMADERGQIYVINRSKSIYTVGRYASSVLSCMDYVHATGTTEHSGYLLVAHESGKLVVVDTYRKEVIHVLQEEGTAPQRHLKCHPTAHVAISISDEMVLSIWDLKKNRCVVQFDSTEPIIDLEFERAGSLIIVAFESSGVSVLRSSDGALVGRLELTISSIIIELIF